MPSARPRTPGRGQNLACTETFGSEGQRSKAFMDNRNIVVIGGSTGATDPLKRILAALPPDLPAAVFVVLHMAAHASGVLATVAAAVARLPVRQAIHGAPIETGTVTIATPDHHMLLVDGHVVLGRGPKENMVRPSIDALFRSAALWHGPRVIGVVLSGLLSDGASGLNAIKACGGMALVQQPSDARADEMPSRAMEATDVDLSVPAKLLGEVIADLAREAPGPRLPVPRVLQLDVDIAAGGAIDSQLLARFAEPAALTCPNCGGVLSGMKDRNPLRFRCQVGHGFTADVLAQEQESRVDEALRIALRIIEERAELVTRLAEEGRRAGRPAVAQMYEERAAEYRAYIGTLRSAALKALNP